MSSPDYRLNEAENKIWKEILRKLKFNDFEADMKTLNGVPDKNRPVIYKMFQTLYIAYQKSVTDKARLKLDHNHELKKQEVEFLQNQVKLLGEQQKQHQDTLVKQQQQQLQHHETQFGAILVKLDSITEAQKEPEFTTDVHNLETGGIEKKSISKENFVALHTAELTIANKKRKTAEGQKDELSKRVKIAEDKEKGSKQQLEQLNHLYSNRLRDFRLLEDLNKIEINSLKASLQEFKSLAQNT
jgi:hypothetical protein